MAGKGSKRRPQKISDEQLQENWNRIFGKKKEVQIVEDTIEDIYKQFALKQKHLDEEFDKAVFDDLESLYEN